MTTNQAATESQTALTLLFPASRRHSEDETLQRHETLQHRLQRGVRVGDLHTAVPTLARDLVWAELATLIGRTMATDLVAIVRGGWQTSTRLTQAARRTLDDPGSCEVVNLADHTIAFTNAAAIDLLIDQLAAVTFHVRVEVDVHITALAAGVEHGRIVNLRSGKSDVTVRLFVDSDEIAHRRVDIDLVAEVNLGKGIELLPNSDRPAVELPSQPRAGTGR
jgi:hypothetical protein